MTLTTGNHDERPNVNRLFTNLINRLSMLEELLKITQEQAYEDRVYRFYHQSCKVFDLQRVTGDIVVQLKELAPGVPLNTLFTEIIAEGPRQDV